ncbi:MAG: DNA helicase UvrD [SAR202 cluster bacterium]|nr:DNA helicase UvrD [SAR202 cluster bacterium]
MRYVADLHIRSSYARGTSPQLTLENLAAWAKLKGIHLLATGDFTHPAWMAELRSKLTDAPGGLFDFNNCRFILGTEVSCVYRQADRTRRVHMLLFVPSFDTMEKLAQSLAQWGNLAEDGRPTLSLSARDLTSLTLETDPRSIVIPAHAWTPWYSVYGSEGGFDSMEECFGDIFSAIPAIETGLSSDPAMNWRMPELDGKSIVSFSDAHSLPRLGREVTAIDGDLTFDGLRQSLQDQSIAYTIEFFPEEGKYHFSGHRNCHVRQSPQETLASPTGKKCPRCGRRMTIGVAHRVEALAARPEHVTLGDAGLLIDPSEQRPPYLRLVPLQEIIAGALGKGVATKAVEQAYKSLIEELGPELPLLQEASIEKIASVAGERVAEGVQRVRDGNITVDPGYDGVYGKVHIWPTEESRGSKQNQLSFTDSPNPK